MNVEGLDDDWKVASERKDLVFVPNVPQPICCGTAERARLVAAAPKLYAACAEFVRKVERGEAKSTRSYAQMKSVLLAVDN